ncbi:MAG: S1/P1 nuclease [Acidimicrobiia bacterium]|nr:S1/P1 nuclease [Acidimicrobiia bacterium]
MSYECRKVSNSVVLLIGLALIQPLAAWNAVGHRAIAGMAYDRLSAMARARVDELLRRHPDYELLTRGGPADAAGKARYAFMTAAVWPDIIKGDERFYDEARPDAKPTPAVKGFPDMKQRRNWHYINVPYSADGTEVAEPPVPNALTQLNWMIPLLGKPEVGKPALEDPVYLLPWFLHVAGDLHQPLHCATRFRKTQRDRNGKPMSDLGGNTVQLTGGKNLHAFWDDSLGVGESVANIERLIKKLRGQKLEMQVTMEPAKWVDEGFEISKSFLYSFGTEGGTKEDPVNLSGAYKKRAKQIAQARASLGAQRIAALLIREMK